LILLGLQRSDAQASRVWRELARFGTAVGFDRLTRPVDRLAEALEQKSHAPRWDMRPTARTVLELACLTELALDLGR
jgi:hypothetical protein